MKKGTSLYLDLVRFSAAMAVFTQHVRLYSKNSFNWFWGAHPFWSWYISFFSQTAVTVFFVLSGYVIAHVLATRERTPIEYAASRFARLYSVVLPALALAAATNFLESLKYPGMFQDFASDNEVQSFFYYLGTAVFVNRFWLLPNLEPFNTPFWTLSFEVAYYVGIALFVFARGRARIMSLLVLCLLAGPTIVLMAPTWLLGYGAYHVFRRELPGKFYTPAMIVIWLAASFCIFLSPFVAAEFRQPLQFLRMPDQSLGELMGVYTAAISFTISLVAFNTFGHRAEFLLTPFERTIRWLGSLTFSLYLFHQPVLAFFNVYGLDRGTIPQMMLMIAGPLAVVVSLGPLCERSKKAYKQFFMSMCERRGLRAAPAK